MKDLIIDEIYEARRQILEECDNDLDRFIEKLKTADRESPRKHVNLEEVRERAKISKSPRRES
ncbi:MAG: hypothetical protein H6752_01510 [Candidatus Omnitrophica bacterium]|nr:hypothetical protein [Candidatus Omnitrophota bacterium]